MGLWIWLCYWFGLGWISTCENCERYCLTAHIRVTDDDVQLCSKCLVSCTEDANRFDYEDEVAI